MKFTNNWFEMSARRLWDAALMDRPIKTYLEIGSYEGASVCWAIQNLENLEVAVCVDTWEGAEEHKAAEIDMSSVESYFDENVSEAGAAIDHHVEVVKLKERSCVALASLINEGYSGAFDLVYVDGSHLASDVLVDLSLGFELLADGGLMVMDDYLWMPVSVDGSLNQESFNPLKSPKLAIDAFTNIYRDKCVQLTCPPSQVMVEKFPVAH